MSDAFLLFQKSGHLFFLRLFSSCLFFEFIIDTLQFLHLYDPPISILSDIFMYTMIPQSQYSVAEIGDDIMGISETIKDIKMVKDA